MSISRIVRPSDVGKVLTVRCLCGCDGDPATGEITGYYRGDKSNPVEATYIGHDRFVLQQEHWTLNLSVGMNEVINESH